VIALVDVLDIVGIRTPGEAHAVGVIGEKPRVGHRRGGHHDAAAGAHIDALHATERQFPAGEILDADQGGFRVVGQRRDEPGEHRLGFRSFDMAEARRALAGAKSDQRGVLLAVDTDSEQLAGGLRRLEPTEALTDRVDDPVRSDPLEIVDVDAATVLDRTQLLAIGKPDHGQRSPVSEWDGQGQVLAGRREPHVFVFIQPDEMFDGERLRAHPGREQRCQQNRQAPGPE